jgi:hypothetical protein
MTKSVRNLLFLVTLFVVGEAFAPMMAEAQYHHHRHYHHHHRGGYGHR